MKETLLKFGLTEEEAKLTLEKYPANVVEDAIKHTVFGTKRNFRSALIISIKHHAKLR